MMKYVKVDARVRHYSKTSRQAEYCALCDTAPPHGTNLQHNGFATIAISDPVQYTLAKVLVDTSAVFCPDCAKSLDETKLRKM